MLWVKSFHIVFVASWFAGLFYLPRIFVNLAMVEPGSMAERARLLLMARKLLRFSNLLAIPALALGLMLSIGRRIPQADRFVRNADWVTEPFAMTHKMTGARLGLVGMGRIAKGIAKRAAAFDMSIAYTSRQAKPELPFTYPPNAAALAAQVDYLVVAVPGGEDTQHMINADVLKALGNKGFVINIARGSVIDQPALIEALKNKTIAGAGLDVFWDEPKVDAELRKLQNVVLTPHIGSNTHETRRAMADLALANLHAFFNKQPLLTPVPECQQP